MIVSKAEMQALCDVAGGVHGVYFHRTRIVASDGVVMLALDREIDGPAEPVQYAAKAFRRVMRIWQAKRDATIDFETDTLHIRAKEYDARVPMARAQRSTLYGHASVIEACAGTSSRTFVNPALMAKVWRAAARLTDGRSGANLTSGYCGLDSEPLVAYGDYPGGQYTLALMPMFGGDQ